MSKPNFTPKAGGNPAAPWYPTTTRMVEIETVQAKAWKEFSLSEIESVPLLAWAYKRGIFADDVVVVVTVKGFLGQPFILLAPESFGITKDNAVGQKKWIFISKKGYWQMASFKDELQYGLASTEASVPQSPEDKKKAVFNAFGDKKK